MDHGLLLGFCVGCQSLFAPHGPPCPACAARLAPVCVTDASPALIREVRHATADGSRLEFRLADGAAHAALVADLLVRLAA
jgi:hypothetical protein